MIFVLMVAVALLCLWIFVRRYHVRERRKELLWMKRHADVYTEKHKSPW
jgi:hypothetical protein